MSKKNSKSLIFAYGFDKAGFTLGSGYRIETDTYVIKFLDYDNSQNLGYADGIITPSGIFESLGTKGRRGEVEWEADRLAKRTKEVTQLSQRGGWIAFLLRAVDNMSGQRLHSDLAKVFLNGFFESVMCHVPNPYLQCKADEFAEYFDEYGINETTFGNPRAEYNPVIIAGDRHAIAAAELSGNFFFLPLPSLRNDDQKLIALATKCVDAILEYKRRHDIHLPHWVESLEFQAEKTARGRIASLGEHIIQLREELSAWRSYKAILSASGKTLNKVVVELLRKYFKLDVISKEEYIEDALIRDGDKTLFVVEIKGVNGGLKRENINQLDSHRERLKLSAEIPGLLIINAFSNIDGLVLKQASNQRSEG